MPSNLSDMRQALALTWDRMRVALGEVLVWLKLGDTAERFGFERAPAENIPATGEAETIKLSREDRLLNGPVLGSLVTLALPIMGTNMLQVANQFIDSFWVGRLGAVGVAAVSVATPLILVLFTFGMGFGIAGSALVAQYYGARQRDMVDQVAGQTLLTVFTLSFGLAIFGILIAPYLLTFMGVAPEVRESALAFLHIALLSLPLSFAYFMFAGLMRGVGRPVIPMLVTACMVVMNFVLNPIFIFGAGPIPALGVAGSAVSTMIAQICAATFAFMMLRSGRFGVRVRFRNLKPNWDAMKRTFLLGYPAAVEGGARGLSVIVMTFLAAGFGTVSTAAYGIGNTISSLLVIPAMGFSMATSTLIGQNIGAKQFERAGRVAHTSCTIGFFTLMACGVITFLMAEGVAKIFVPNDASVVADAGVYIRILSCSFGFLGLQYACIGVLRGAGLMSKTMLITVIAQWMVQFPLCYILAEKTPLGMHGIYWGVFGANIIACLIAYGMYAQGDWKRARLIETARA